MDLHLHTPASVDYKQPTVTYLDFLKKAEDKNLDVIAFADHNSVTGYARYLEEVESLELLERLGRLRDDERKRLEEYRRLRDKILILPGFEFTATLGFHILGIFPPDTTVRELEHLLLLLRVPPEKLDQGSGEVGATTDALTAYRMINEAGGLVIAAHANSSHGVAMPGFDFGGQTRIAYTQDPNLHALEVTDLDSKSRRRTAAFFSGTKPEYPRRMHCIQGSDAHKLDFDPRYKNEMGVGDRATEILVDDLTFEAIRDVFLSSDFSRTRPYRPSTEEPFDPVRDAREQGDNLVQSFHERLHEKRGVARSILEDVVALANTNGGTIYIGANANPKTVVVGVERPDQAGVELRGAVSKEITPPLEVQVDVIKSQGKSLLQVIVPRGSEVPYALEGTYIYVRSENETGLAVRDEIVQLVRDALAVELAATGNLPPGIEKPPAEQAHPAPQPVKEAPVLPLVPQVEPPRTGVEIVDSQVRKGITYYSVRDLRNNRVVQNVTRSSARRLWQYAIEEQEKHACDPDQITWTGNIGICKSHKRGGKMRYDLVQRIGGKLLVYYGVTEDGIHGEWRKLVEIENGVESEESPSPDGAGEAPAEQIESEAVATPADVVPEESAAGLAFARELEPPEFIPEEHLPRDILVEETNLTEPIAVEPQREMRETDEESTEMAPAAQTIEDNEPMRWLGLGTETVAADQMTEPAAAGEQEQIQPEPPSVKEPVPAPSAPPAKSRAQTWREILDRAIEQARSEQSGKSSPGKLEREGSASVPDDAQIETGGKSLDMDLTEEQGESLNQPPEDLDAQTSDQA